MIYASSLLEFAPVFEGSQPEVSDLEALDAAAQFREGIESLFITHMAAVRHSGKKEWTAARSEDDYLFLDFQPDKPTRNFFYVNRRNGELDRPSLRIFMQTSVGIHADPAASSKIEVLITERDDYGNDVRSIGYLLFPNGEQVYRHEAKDAYELHHGNWAKTIGQIVMSTNNLNVLSDAINEQGNQRLEAIMGTNNQAVRVAEISSLIELLQKSTVNWPADKK